MTRKSELDVTEEFKKKMKEGSTPPRLDTGIYYWVWAMEPMGGKQKRVLLGPFMSEDEAYTRAYSKLSGNFEVVSLATRDVTLASRILRARVLDETGDSMETFKRFRHKLD
jgi:hypothetical protein